MHIPDNYDIVDATIYFRVHDDGQLYLLYLPAIQMVYTPTGTSVRPEAFPATPRAHQPELSFLGQMPKDFFRCPTCGKSVPKENRTQVPRLAPRLAAPCRPLPPPIAAARRPPPAARRPHPPARRLPPAARCPQPATRHRGDPLTPLRLRGRCLSVRC